nr:PREDICTED: insulin receptor substrate 2-A-like [Lepisosteus oculatus]
MENQSPEPYYEDVRKCGYLRKQKSMHKRYFVLRAASERGPARLEYYENEKKFRGKTANPKKVLNLETCFNINKRADAKNKHLIVVYTREESFSIAAESEADQGDWYQAMVELQCKSKVLGESPEYGALSPGPAFKEVWQVKVWPKGLGQSKSLVGIYRLCLTDKTVNFVKLNSDAAAVVLQLMNVRRCGHSENFFFVEVGRSAVTGPGEFWMQVEDSVVAQNMHETLLEAMKALSEEFRQRSKSQSSAGAGAGAGGGGGGGGRGLSNGTGPPRRTQDRGPEGRLLSSSSYSSSSASSESLGEGDERPNGRGGGIQVGGGARAKEGPQRRAGQPRSRPVSLFVDVSKANTLPRVREAPLPPEPKSPGEYVSIEYRGGGVPGIPHPSGPARPLQRPGSCLGGLHGHGSPEPHASEYVNMDLGPLLAPLGFPGYPTPAAAPLAFDEHRPDLEPSEEPGRGKHGASVPEESPTFGDYTEMAFSLGPPSPRSASPGGVASVGLGLDFPLSKPTPNPDQGAKVIRADPQGRRRHCSETFLATQSLPPSSSSSSSSSSSFSLFPDHAQAAARRLAFDGVWGKGGACDGANEPAPLCAIPRSPAVPVAQAPPSSSSSSMEQGLNYIDLDLASKDSPHATLEAAPSAQVASRLYSSGLVADGGGSAAVLNTYASIDFYKSEELRAHQSSSKEGTEC